MYTQALKVTRKVMSKLAREARPEHRAAFVQELLSNYSTEQLVWVDETRSDKRSENRIYGRAPAGQRALGRPMKVKGIGYNTIGKLWRRNHSLMMHYGPTAAVCAEGHLGFFTQRQTWTSERVCWFLKYVLVGCTSASVISKSFRSCLA